MRKMLIVLCLLTAMAAHAAKVDYNKMIPANDAAITFTGRTKTIEGGAVTFDWTGVYMQTLFKGTAAAVRLSSDKACGYNVFVDGKLINKFIDREKEAHNVELVSGLSKGTHELRLQKCTEGGEGYAMIFGFFFDKGATLQPITPKKRFIEVFGDSYTCGYGAESKSASEHFSVETENCDQAYACIIARYFDADYNIQAHSGQGMVRNWGDQKCVTEGKTMSTRQWFVFDNHDTELYTDSTRRPDIVIVNLGTNDFSRNNSPKENQFVNGYLKFVKKIRTRYGDVPVICVVPHTACQYLKTCMRMLKERTGDMKNVEIIGFTDGMVTVKHDTGADGHPNYQGHKKIAMTLIPMVSTMTGWSMTDKTVE